MRYTKSQLLRRRRGRGKAEREANRSEEAQLRLDALSDGTFISLKPPKPECKKRNKTLYLQRREEGLQKQREHRDATA